MTDSLPRHSDALAEIRAIAFDQMENAVEPLENLPRETVEKDLRRALAALQSIYRITGQALR